MPPSTSATATLLGSSNPGRLQSTSRMDGVPQENRQRSLWAKRSRPSLQLVLKVVDRLIEDIKASGPVQSGYHNYSKLGENTYHCHLAYKWVACWRNEKGKLIVEVEYVGSREKAPY